VLLDAKQLDGVHPTTSNDIEVASPDSDPEKTKSVETVTKHAGDSAVV
jgi:hypothetical protein